MTKKKPPKLSDQLRQAMDNAGKTRYQIAKETGMNQSALGKFYHGQRGLSIDTLDRLGECLNLQLVRRPDTDHKRKQD